MSTVTDNSRPPEISAVYLPNDVEQATKRLTEIKFDCIVRMHDCGFRTPKSPPQWFKQEMHLTLEFIKSSDEYAIGRAVKEGFTALMKHIEQYEKDKL